MRTIVESASDYKLKKIEKELLSQRPLKLAKTTPEEFSHRKKPKYVLWDILNAVFYEKNTVYADDSTLECTYDHVGRSQGDLFRIMRYYYPSITFKEFRALLFEMVSTGNVQTSYCTTINKRVFVRLGKRLYIKPRMYSYIYSDAEKDELGLTLKTNVL